MAKHGNTGTDVKNGDSPFATLVGSAISGDGEAPDVKLYYPNKGRAGLEAAAMQWTYVLRSRQRWANTADAVEDQALRATKQLEDFRVSNNDIKRLAKYNHIEMRLSGKTSDEETWSARIFPWEFMIAAATQQYRQGQPITVSRVLAMRGRKGSGLPKNPKVLYVESAPGVIADVFNFTSERELFKRYFQTTKDNFRESKTPTLAELSEVVDKFRPDIIHLAGVDTHQAKQIIHQVIEEREENEEPEERNKRRGFNIFDLKWRTDGYLLANPSGAAGYEIVSAQKLAKALTVEGKHSPWLIAMNLENSGGRIASRAVEVGAAAAIGFQDTFDEDMAELFFSTFYSELHVSRGNLAVPFRIACETVKETVKARNTTLTGSGLVLWSQRPLLNEMEKARLPQSLRTVDPNSVKGGTASERIRVVVEPLAEINYSLLHNGGTLFKTFQLMPEPDVRAFGIGIRVVLHTGSESASFEKVVDVVGRLVDLRRVVRVALSASLIRSVHESIVTTLFVEVRWGKHLLKQDTYPVRLLPIDQWKDAEMGRHLLPSFVFPRDPAVGSLIIQAAKYAKVLRDDPSAGFEGYQCISEVHPNDTRHVDLQVQAVWSAILLEWRLTYINPPPAQSVASDSQRLRTPSMIERERCGTCIDLALLFAACCELIDIYPVIFLLKGHAFPAYWRSPDYHKRFKRAGADPASIEEIVEQDEDGTNVGGAQKFAWCIGATMYPEIVREVREGKLVPLETVRITENCGFAEAMEAGRESLADRKEFDSLIDISLARESGITPLPLWGEQS